MDPRLHGVPLSVAPKVAPSYHKTSGIRAPLTVDESDYENSVSLKSHKNSTTSSYCSGSELESEGFESGEDEFENASDGPHLVDQDEEILEETHFLKEYKFSEPSVVNPNGVLAKENGSVSGNAFLRPLVRNPDGRICRRISDVDDSDDSRSFLSDSGDELGENRKYVVNYVDSRPIVAKLDEEVSEIRPTPVVDVKVPLVQKFHIPIARISGDSDDDSQSSEVFDDIGFSGIVRIPSIEVLHRVNSAPRVRILESDEEDENESQDDDIVEMKSDENLKISNAVLGPSDEEEHFGIEMILADRIQDGSPDTNKEATDKSLVVNEELNFTSESVENADPMHLDEGLREIDDPEKCEELVVAEGIVFPESISDGTLTAEPSHLCDRIKLTEPAVSELISSSNSSAASVDAEDTRSNNTGLEDNLVFNHVNESEKVGSKSEQEIDQTVESSSSNAAHDISSVHQCVDSHLCDRIKLTEPAVSESISSRNFSAASVDDEDTRSGNTGLEDNLVFNHVNESEKVESKSEQEIDQTVESSSSNAAHDISSVHQCVHAKELPFMELTEALVESMQICTSDSLSKDASLTGVVNADRAVSEGSNLEQGTRKEAENSDWLTGEVEPSTFHADKKVVAAVTDRVPDSTSSSDREILVHSQEIDGQVVIVSDEVRTDDGIGGRRQIIDPAALAVFPEAVRGLVSDDGATELPAIDDFALKSNLVDLGLSHSAGPLTGARNSDNFVPPSTNGELEEALNEREKKFEKMQQVRVKYLRLLHRLGLSPEDSVASKVLYHLALADESSCSQAFHLDSAKKAAVELETQTKDDIDSSLCILVIGKTGVGKSATINSIFGERKTAVNAFEPATTNVNEIIGTIDGLKLKVLDTPGLRTSLMEQPINRNFLSSIKKLMQKSPPDVILYVDRLDMQTSSLNDLPLLKLVTSYLGSSIWRKIIFVFTHGTSIPPDGPDGYPLSNEVFAAQQSQVIQHLICHSSEELLVKNPRSTIPVCVVENHLFTQVHNGESWRSELLLLCYSMKTLSEVSSLAMIQNPLKQKKLFGMQIRLPALSSFLQSNIHPKPCNDQSGESVVSDVELCHSIDSDHEYDIECDNHPPRKPLKRSQIAKLKEDQHRTYFEEYEYHIKLVQKKQLREEMRPFRKMMKLKSGAGDETYMARPPFFDGDDSSLRYPFLAPSSQLLTRPLLNSHGWDNDCGYDGVLIEDEVDIGNHFPAVISVQLTKDKKEFDLHLCSSISANQTSLGMSVMRYRGDLVYGCNLQSQFSLGRNSKLSINAGLNNKLSGQISVKTSCADQLQIAALAFVLLRKFFDKRPRITQT